ncbi:MAG: thioredoxin domain-containing protein [Candidatus Hydrogenedentes bacterium]|nr:thioredoxin domain-containing protein [Candidatus Hydrogenedentota bacterium]
MEPRQLRISGRGLAATFLAGILFVLLAGCAAPAENVEGENIARSDDTKDADAVQATSAEEHTNRLIHETSPYLLQHAHNPVDWYPWGEEAFEKAHAEDKPIFLSVGYSSCHWCHVMERESFENEEIAAMLNEYFVSIKVDREERPDVDEIYMSAVQAMTGSGGWPMSVFLTPDLKPFFGGTYFPPTDRYGRPGFKSVLTKISTAWRDGRPQLLKGANELTEYMGKVLVSEVGKSGKLTPDLIAKAVQTLATTFDSTNGGFGPAPKFPPGPAIAILLREHQRTQDDHTLRMATLTLDKMAQGGMYDHLGGGFARYSTDDEWLVPHFEKMLYDNAQLAQIYIEAYQATKDPLYKQVVEETFEYILRDMTDERGGFHSAEDADSEGEEGKFYLWTYEEIFSLLDPNAAKLFCAYYNVKKNGNFSSREPYHRGLNILHTPRPAAEIAKKFKLSETELHTELNAARKVLLETRNTRVRPGLDDKVLTSWNALMISALAQGYQVLGDDRYREAAERAGNFILKDMLREDGTLLHTHRHGDSRLPGYLDDYAFFANALTDLYEATFDVAWLEAADRIATTMIEKFWDTDRGGFYFTGSDHKNLLVRTRPTYDGAVPSGNSIAALALLRLSKLLDSEEYYDKARVLLESNQSALTQAPRGYLKMLCAVDYLLYPPKEIAIAGAAGSEGVEMLLSALHAQFIPNKVVAFVDPADSGAEALGNAVPLLAGKKLVSGNAAAYVCENFACKLPVTTPEQLLKQLDVTGGEG